MKKSQIIRRSALEFCVVLLVFNLINFTLFIIFQSVNDWELFSYNLFGSILVYFIFFLTSVLRSLIFSTTNFLLKIIGDLLFLELSFMIAAGGSLLYHILFYAISDENYILFFYPICLIGIRILWNIQSPKNKNPSLEN
ncbi:hypothetical protein [Flavobacterium silvaticum]|uniref:Uncharacterized protein n=1 Tax=Flavobacterium silvaticum TaxID=1852020 RepID=A0A972JIP6_9FLAO|nr:hypothetical protein [Flavobacterium silvaticum]NMH28498.1 hypothetical protein [Flavobacterium silvaticum]